MGNVLCACGCLQFVSNSFCRFSDEIYRDIGGDVFYL